MSTVEITVASPATGIDVRRYGKMLARFAPKVIETEGENEAALAIVKGLMEKGEENFTQEESALFDLITNLIEQFEERTYPIPDAPPNDVLRDLMEHHSLKAADLVEILGSRAKVSEILSGKRSISKKQAKQLGERFGLSPAAFI
jgi:HTH-type transcriptional regulator/antitoxin HigA